MEQTVEYLARKASMGDTQSFAELCDRLKKKLFRTAKGILGNEALALDAVSEAVYRAFTGIKKLRQPEYAETWFVRILINAAACVFTFVMCVTINLTPLTTASETYYQYRNRTMPGTAEVLDGYFNEIVNNFMIFIGE